MLPDEHSIGLIIEYTTNNIATRSKIEIPTISGQGTPSLRKRLAKKCYLYRSTQNHLAFLFNLSRTR